jgi:NAD(P)H-hydrate epimerase
VSAGDARPAGRRPYAGRARTARPTEPSGPTAPPEPPEAVEPEESPPAVVRLDEQMAAGLLPERDPRGHKGTFGRLLVVAGSLDYAGAALMAGAAALRTGAGLVTLCLPASLQPQLAGRVPELITLGLPESAPGEVIPAEAADLIGEREHDALLVGPGLRPGGATTRLVLALVTRTGPAVAIDAGALDALAGVPGWPPRLTRDAVLTPHPGEFRRLGRDPGGSAAERREAARSAAREWGAVVVLKGAGTVIAAPDGRVLEAPFVLPALASAGTGDVLAGAIASLLAQGCGALDAAALGVFLHGRAGEHVSERLGDAGLMATDLLPEIPRARRHLAAIRSRRGSARLGFTMPAARESTA